MTLRKLAATIFADIQGYSALMQTNEPKALLAQEKFQNQITETVPVHNGEVVQFYGDGCLMIFNSASEALTCAQVLQDYFRNEDVPVRIGIHIGEVVMRSDNVFGDSVNLASRIESMGVPGSILFSAAIADNVRNQPDIKFQSLGFHHFKNIEKPVEVFALDGYTIPDKKKLAGKFRDSTSPNKNYPVYAGIAIIALLLIGWFTKDRFDVPENGESTKSALAIFPFEIIGNNELTYLKNALPELLSSNLQNVGSISVVDPNAIISLVGENTVVKDPQEGKILAQKFNASNYILGDLTTVGNRINLSASLYNAAGSKINQETVRSENQSDLPLLIDELSRKLITKNLGERNSDILRTGAMMTTDLEALRLFFNGEDSRRLYKMNEAIDFYRQAFQKDTTFYLALYRLVYIENAIFGIDGDYEKIKTLQDNLDKLPPKYKELAGALFQFLGHNAHGSINSYTYLYNNYPNDLEVNLMLGEALFHHNKLLGKSDLEALPYFENVYKYDSLNQEAISHLIYLYILKKDFDALEKFSQEEFGMSLGLDKIIQGDTILFQQAVELLSNTNYPASGIIAINTLDDHLIEILDFLSGVREKKSLPMDQFVVLLDHLAKGHENYVLENGLSQVGPAFTLFPVILAPHPEIPGYKNDLSFIYKLVEGKEKVFASLPFGSENNIKEIQCLIAIAEDDHDGFNRYYKSIEEKAKNNPDQEGYLQFTKHYFQGIIDFRKEAYDDALFHFEALDNFTLSLEDDQSQFYYRPLPRFMRAEILMKKGRYDEALGFLENYWLYPGNIPLIPWTYLRRAEIYEAQGRNKKAIEFYGKFITLYESSDAQYQPFVNNARNLREELIKSIN